MIKFQFIEKCQLLSKFFAGFDDIGRQIDANGNHVNWWQENTINEFTSRAQCFIDQVIQLNFTKKNSRKFIQMLYSYPIKSIQTTRIQP